MKFKMKQLTQRKLKLKVSESGIHAYDDMFVYGNRLVDSNSLVRQSLSERFPVVFIDEAQAAFSFGSTRLVTALIEGNFPNYDVVIPKKHDKEGVLKTTTFMEAVRR